MCSNKSLFQSISQDDSDSEKKQRNSPLDHASVLSVVLFSWLTPLIRLGASRTLEIEDIYDVPYSHRTKVALTRLTSYWQEEIRTNPDSPRLGRALIMCFIVPLFLSNTVFLFYAAVTMMQPFFVTKILEYVENGDVSFLGVKSGIAIAITLGCVSLVGIFSFSLGFYFIQLFGLYCKNCVIGLVFEKSLKISNGARTKHTTGEIVTLMSVDAERIWQGILLSTWYWMGPLMIAGAIVLLVFAMGYAALICCGVMVLWFWFQMNVGTWLGNIRDRMVKYTDERVKLTNEVLQGIRVVKLYAWEGPSEERINKLRALEVQQLRWYHFLKMINLSIQFVGPLVVSFVLFLSYYLLGGRLTVAKVYTALAILNIIRLPVAIVPLSIAAGEEAIRSLNRIKSYLSHSEMVPLKRLKYVDCDDSCLVKISDASFTWSEDASSADSDEERIKYTLRGVNLTICEGEFVAVVGAVGSGKSSLVSAMLGQIYRVSGTQELNANVAYVGQEHWIQNITLQDNVLFGSSLDEERYADTLDACQMSKDLLSLPNADYTEIGERGITLSGGQKARVNIARAIYAEEKNLYIFDDPLAAVDVHVGRAIFDNAFKRRLKGKARVLVLSSNYHFLPQFDKIIVVDHGNVVVCSSYEDLKSRFPQFASTDGENRHIAELAQEVEINGTDRSTDGNSNDEDSINSGDSCNEAVASLRQTPKQFSLYRSNRDLISAKQQSGKVLTTQEDREKGNVSLNTYIQYFNSSVDANSKYGGFRTIAILVALFTVGQASRVFSDMWMGIWAADVERKHQTHTNLFYLTWFIVLVFCTIVFVFGRAQYFVLTCLRASRNLHSMLLSCLLSAPVNTYFDITPVGRILNRFSKDMDMMDSLLPDYFLQNIQNSFHIASVLILCILASPYFIIIMVLLGVVFAYIQHLFRRSSTQMKRLEGVTRSPMYSLFGEMLVGLSTIRAYEKQNEFLEKHCDVADANNKSLFSFWMASRWLALRLDLVSNTITVSVSLIAVLIVKYGGSVDSNTLGLALVYSLQLASFLQWTVRVAIETENNMTAVERLLSFNNIDSEAPRHVTSDPVSEWPTDGRITMKNLSMRYRPGLNTVLSDVSLSVQGGYKIGVCGRTGAGKSSLMLALFRMVEPDQGSILEIDGVDVLKMGLHKLRTQLTIIPQDPVMFSGSLRYNLDPYDRYSDLEVWEALERAHLKEDVSSKFPNQLNHQVAERGENLSVGQRQLLCIARALLRKSKIIIMDEATASVDTMTDRKIQSTVRTEFRSCTVLTIAHRLETIADYDRIIVMDAGKMVEYGIPYDLMRIEDGVFASLVSELGPEVKAAFVETMRTRAESLKLKEKDSHKEVVGNSANEVLHEKTLVPFCVDKI